MKISKGKRKREKRKEKNLINHHVSRLRLEIHIQYLISSPLGETERGSLS